MAGMRRRMRPNVSRANASLHACDEILLTRLDLGGEEAVDELEGTFQVRGGLLSPQAAPVSRQVRMGCPPRLPMSMSTMTCAWKSSDFRLSTA